MKSDDFSFLIGFVLAVRFHYENLLFNCPRIFEETPKRLLSFKKSTSPSRNAWFTEKVFQENMNSKFKANAKLYFCFQKLQSSLARWPVPFTLLDTLNLTPGMICDRSKSPLEE